MICLIYPRDTLIESQAKINHQRDVTMDLCGRYEQQLSIEDLSIATATRASIATMIEWLNSVDTECLILYPFYHKQRHRPFKAHLFFFSFFFFYNFMTLPGKCRYTADIRE